MDQRTFPTLGDAGAAVPALRTRRGERSPWIFLLTRGRVGTSTVAPAGNGSRSTPHSCDRPGTGAVAPYPARRPCAASCDASTGRCGRIGCASSARHTPGTRDIAVAGHRAGGHGAAGSGRPRPRRAPGQSDPVRQGPRGCPAGSDDGHGPSE
jgi:hypothetical protein